MLNYWTTTVCIQHFATCRNLLKEAMVIQRTNHHSWPLKLKSARDTVCVLLFDVCVWLIG